MIVAAHQTMLAPQGGPSSLDYVQDGLYYQLDGIENAGRGVHDASASVWTDLTGNGRDATFINAASGLVWQDDAAYLYGETHDGMAKIRGLPSMTAFTFETVYRVDSHELAGRLWDSEAYQGGYEGKRFFAMRNDLDTTSINIANNGDLQFPIPFVSASARTLSVMPTAYSTTVATCVYFNGAFLETKNPPTIRTPRTMTYIDVANRSNNPNRGSDMAVFAIRCYNRVLTAAEIAANYAIDKARFNLP